MRDSVTGSAFRYPDARILLFTREPVVGQVKTRLHEAIGAEKAFQLHCAMLQYQARTLREAYLAPWELWVSGDVDNPLLNDLVMPVERFPQQGSDLGLRMQHAAESALARASTVVLIGTDCPSIDCSYLAEALALLQGGYDAVIGPAEDGGYVLLGLRRCHPQLFTGVPWGSAGVLDVTLGRLTGLGWRHSLLATRWDVDCATDLARLRTLAPPLDFQLPESGKSASN